MLDQFVQTLVEHKLFEIILSFLIASIDELLPLPWWATQPGSRGAGSPLQQKKLARRGLPSDKLQSSIFDRVSS